MSVVERAAPMPGAADAAPVVAATAGADPRVRVLFDTHHDGVHRLLRRLGVGAAQVDDAVQDVFVVAARRIEEIREGAARAFLYGVAVRVASHVHRQAKVRQQVDLEAIDELVAHDPSPEDALAERRARAILDVVLQRMPPDLREVFVLVEIEELEVREVAEMLRVPVGTAASRLRRARDEFTAAARRTRAALERGGR